MKLPLPTRTSALLAVSLLASASCSTVGETGRSQFALIPDDFLTSSSVAAYEEETAKFPQITSGPKYDMVQRVGKKLAAASGMDGDWEFRLLDAPDVVNAFALPGGKLAVYTGLLSVTQNEDALAAVMGHEVAHVTARHGSERLTQSLASQGALIAGNWALGEWTELAPENRALCLQGLAVVSEVGVILPFSRAHESEADEIGLRYLVRAGYDPNEAPLLWERMAKLGGASGADPWKKFTSTHPDPLDRAERLRALIPTIVAEERAK